MDAIPRITRAQPMDALSSQATVAGYKAVLLAAEHRSASSCRCSRPRQGRSAPAKVLVLGAGVAGLQAIATARRLGAVVSAYDMRPVVKEQVESLGAHVPRARRRGRRGRRRLRDRALRGRAGPRAGADALARGRVGRRDHDRAHPRQARAAPPHRGGRRRDAAGLGHRRPRRRDGRELRADRGRARRS